MKNTKPDKEALAAAKKRKSLIATGVGAAVVLVFNLLCLFFYLPTVLRAGLFRHFLVTCVMALAIFVMARFISNAVLREFSAAGNANQPAPAVTPKKTRFILLAIMAVGLELVLIRYLGPSAKDSIYFDLAFYLVFFGCGVLLAREQDADFVPVLFALIVVITLSLVQFAQFVHDPTAVSRYGPERFIIGLRNFVLRADMLPLEMAITWAAWRVAWANRFRPASPRRS